MLKELMNNETRRWLEGALFFALFCLTIPAANWLIQHVGTVCTRNGPCLIPVAPGLMAPSGVLMVGAALVLRDLVQRRLGFLCGRCSDPDRRRDFGLVAPLALVTASAAAYLLSEFSDLAVYTPLQERRFMTAVIASSVVGLIVDLHRVFVAGLRLAGIPGGTSCRQGLDGPVVDPADHVSATPRSGNRTRSRVTRQEPR